MRRIIVAFGILAIVGCKKDDPKPPEAALLEFPLQNSECTTGVEVSTTTSEVEFRWQAAERTDSYELQVTHLITNTRQTATRESTSARLVLEKGAPYSWLVISRSSTTQETATSVTWQFYNAGSQTTYAPFPAIAVSPKSGASAVRDINNEISLEWSAADVDNDISSYDVYFGEVNPPTEVVSTQASTDNTFNAATLSNTVYYWKIVTKDEAGNSSDSGVFSLKSL